MGFRGRPLVDELGHRLEGHIPALRRYAYALTRNPEAADDLVQDCLERAISRWRLRRDEGDLRAWLFTILRNHYISGYRARRRREPDAALDADEHGGPPTQEAPLIMRDVLAAIEELPEDQKTLLLLIGVEDLSYDQAAQVLGVPTGTVMSRLSRARARLRDLLDGGRPATKLRRVK